MGIDWDDTDLASLRMQVRIRGGLPHEKAMPLIEEVAILREERDQLRGEVAALRAALTDVLGHLPSDEVLSESWQGEMMWDDIFELAKIIPKYRAALAAVPADARGEEQHDGGR